jgi:LPXTG-motif cell wall-anchored protein
MMTGLPSWIPAGPSVPGAGGGGASGIAGAMGGGLGGGYSGEISEQNPNLNALKSENKNKLSASLDLSGSAGARGAVFNFGTQANPIVSAAGGSSTVIWIVGGLAVLGIAALFILRRKS